MNPIQTPPCRGQPQALLDQALGSARLAGLANPDPAFVGWLAAYSHGQVDTAALEARLPAVIAAAITRERHR
jgi:hypothetical protein